MLSTLLRMGHCASLTGRSTSSNWPRASTSLQRRLKMFTCVAFLCCRCLCTETVYRYFLNSDSVTFNDLFKGTVFIDCFSCRKAYLVGIVVPDPEVFVSWAEERGFVESYKELCQNPVGHRAFLHSVSCLYSPEAVLS